MKQSEVFQNACWLGMPKTGKGEKSYVLRGKFNVTGAKTAMLRVIGLGFFHCYINGKRVGDDLFLPLNSDFEKREAYPVDEIVSGHRIYVPEYDITSYLKDGENVIAIHFGGGWYTFGEGYFADDVKRFGDAKAIWRIWGEGADGAFEFVSSEADKLMPGFVEEYIFNQGGTHNYLLCDESVLDADYPDDSWPNATKAVPLDTEYLFTDCPSDGVGEILQAKKLDESEECIVYDATKNISGYPVLKLKAEKGEKIKVVFAEELTADGQPDPAFGHCQQWNIISDGKERIVRPLFTWFGFRYFAVYGAAEVIQVEMVHAKVTQSAAFVSDNELLNWIHDTFLNTQLTNMHAGIPSDCPHIERRGYTGDGQLICRSAMHILDAERFYRKWIADIRDCQDVISGHVQYTAPYVHSGGGPGGWGCAIVEVPYQFYLHYGDVEVLKECYPNMLRYFDYLESHSTGNLVITDKEGDWCLGDWCPPIEVVLSAPFVNNYFYIRSLERCIEIARLIGKEEDIPGFEAKISERKDAINAAYFNKWDGNFFGCLQGANAYALDIGLGDERTYQNLVEHYKKTGGYDTGIFGTELVTRILLEHGDAQLACDLLLSETAHSYIGMKKAGATTFWEYWPESLTDRSHNHPMFGAVISLFYDYFLGIQAKDASAGYKKLCISPVIVDGINTLSGHRTLPAGVVFVSYEKDGESISFSVTVPDGVEAEFVYNGEVRPLQSGENQFKF